MSDSPSTSSVPLVRAVVIGRHALDFGDEPIQVIEQRNVTFPVTARACVPVLGDLLDEARGLQVRLLFQAVPAQVAAALLRIRDSDAGGTGTNGLWLGFVINKPRPREAGVTRTFRGPVQVMTEIAHFANPNAKVSTTSDDAGSGETVAVTVDPPMKFVFSHIEWLTL